MFLTALVMFCFATNAFAQLSATANGNATELAQALVGTGVTVTNATLTCPQYGAGFFTATPQSLGIGQGVVLTSGYAQDPTGSGADLSSPNDASGTTGDNLQLPGDPQLQSLAANTTYDACVLEFDVVPTGDTLKFDYIFGSEEYNEYVNAGYNDVFGFFISGPGIAGQQNIATVPHTSVPVAIDNVNCSVYSQYYICNDAWLDPWNSNCAAGQCPDVSDPWDPEYDGLTVVLTAKAVVQPCQTYHLKLGVADVGDNVLDSGVFLKQGSLTSAVVVASPDVSICPGQSTQLNVTGGGTTASYQWSPGTALSCTNCQNPIANPAVTTTYTVVVSAGAGCSASDEVVVTANGGIEATLTPAPANCNASNGSIAVIVSTGVAPYSYSWNNGASTQSLSNAAAGTYTVSISDANGCSSSFSATIGTTGGPETTGNVVNSTCGLPNGSIDITITGGATPYAMVWSNGATSQDINGLVANQYIITVTDAAGCVAQDTFEIETTTVPVISYTSVAPVCSASNGSVNATISNGTAPYSFIWSNGNSSEDLDGVAAGTFELTVTDVNLCSSAAEIILTAELPVPIALNGLVDSVCSGSSFTVAASGYDQYVWTPAAGLSATSGDSVVVTGVNSQSWSMIGTDANGCIDTAEFELTVLPFASVSYNSTFGGCESLAVTLTANPQNATSVEWWIGADLVSTEFAVTRAFYSGTFSGMLVAVSPLGCNDTVYMTDFINVQPTPNAAFTVQRDVSTGDLFTFIFTNQSTSASSYLWTFGDSTNSTLTNPHHVFPGFGVYHVLLSASNESGCTDTALRTIEVTVPHEIFIPNTFTPNGDGQNETFRIFGLGISSYRVSIFDRLGEKLHEGTNDDAHWDGTFKGKPLNTSTFVYIAEIRFLDGATRLLTGDVTILR